MNDEEHHFVDVLFYIVVFAFSLNPLLLITNTEIQYFESCF